MVLNVFFMPKNFLKIFAKFYFSDMNEISRLGTAISSLTQTETTFTFDHTVLSCKKRRYETKLTSIYEQKFMQHVFDSLPHNLQGGALVLLDFLENGYR